MGRDKNFLARAFDAVMAGRERRARQLVERFEREHGNLNGKLTKQ